MMGARSGLDSCLLTSTAKLLASARLTRCHGAPIMRVDVDYERSKSTKEDLKTTIKIGWS